MARYTDEERAEAVALLTMRGYPENKYALKEVSKHFGVHVRTLRRWFNKKQNPPPDKLVQQAKKTIIERLHELLNLHIDAAGETIDDADHRAIMTGLGITVDKMQLLGGEPTERTDITSGGNPIGIVKMDIDAL